MGPSWGSKEQPFHKSEHSVDVERSLFSKTSILLSKSPHFWQFGMQIGAAWATPFWARFMPEWDRFQNLRCNPKIRILRNPRNPRNSKNCLEIAKNCLKIAPDVQKWVAGYLDSWGSRVRGWIHGSEGGGVRGVCGRRNGFCASFQI